MFSINLFFFETGQQAHLAVEVDIAAQVVNNVKVIICLLVIMFFAFLRAQPAGDFLENLLSAFAA